MDELGKTFGLDDFDSLPPLVKMPRHLEPARGLEPHLQRAIVGPPHSLTRMKSPFRRTIRCLRSEPPNDLTKLAVVLERAKRSRRVRCKIKALIACKPLIGHNRRLNSVKAEMPKRPTFVWLPGDEVAARSEKNAVWFHKPPAATIAKQKPVRSPQRRCDGIGYFLRNNDDRTRPGGNSVDFEHRFGIRFCAPRLFRRKRGQQSVAQARQGAGLPRITPLAQPGDSVFEPLKLLVPGESQPREGTSRTIQRRSLVGSSAISTACGNVSVRAEVMRCAVR